MPKKYRDKVFDYFDARLPEGSFRRRHFANAISAGGAALVGAGAVLDIAGHRLAGMTLRAVGEFGDDLDGDTARRLGTAGRSGAWVDSFLDKGKVATHVIVLWKHATDKPEIPMADRRSRIAAIGAKHIVNAALNGYIESQGSEASSSDYGKVNVYVDGVTFGLWGFADVFENYAAKRTLNTLGNITFGIGLVTGGAAMSDYARRALEARHSNKTTPAAH